MFELFTTQLRQTGNSGLYMLTRTLFCFAYAHILLTYDFIITIFLRGGGGLVGGRDIVIQGENDLD